MGLIAIPVLAFVAPERLPQIIVMVAFPMALYMLWETRKIIDFRTLTSLLSGRLIGVFPGIWILLIISTVTLKIILAVTTIAAALTVVLKNIEIAINKRNQFIAGLLSGFLSTTTGIGGPPVAILFSGGKGAIMRGALSFVVVIGSLITIMGYVVSGIIGVEDLVLTLIFLVPMVTDLMLGVRLRPRIEGPGLVRLVSGITVVSAVGLLAQTIVFEL